MRRRLSFLAVAIAMLAVAAWLRPPPQHTFADRVRALARPFALPLLWSGLRAARSEESPEAVAARGRQLLALLPEWADGHVLFASELAFAASTRAPTPDDAADRVMAALTTLEEAIRMHPPGKLDYLSAMASFVEIRANQDRTLAAALEQRLGMAPQLAADAYLVRAEDLSPSRSISDRRTYLLLPAIETALRTHDGPRALATIERMQIRLQNSVNQELAQRWQRALVNLAGFLRGDSHITLQSLNDDPLLQDMVDYLPERPR